MVLALVISKFDYCNSLLAGLLTSTLNVLQKVQNVAARLICQLRPRDHVSSYLQQLPMAAHTVTCVVQTIYTNVQNQLWSSSKIHYRPCQHSRCVQLRTVVRRAKARPRRSTVDEFCDNGCSKHILE